VAAADLDVGTGGSVGISLRLAQAALLRLQPLQLVRQPPPMDLPNNRMKPHESEEFVNETLFCICMLKGYIQKFRPLR
jgi:hypothetical protein